jgi:hypothetical protein
MPVPGVPNNPSGVNNFNEFAPEPAYGEGTKQKALAGGAPLAGGRVAAGSLNAANRAQDQATAPAKTPQPSQTNGPASEPVPIPATGEPGPTPLTQTLAELAAESAGRYPTIEWLAQAARG